MRWGRPGMAFALLAFLDIKYCKISCARPVEALIPWLVGGIRFWFDIAVNHCYGIFSTYNT